jgi:hypothetical protein
MDPTAAGSLQLSGQSDRGEGAAQLMVSSVVPLAVVIVEVV